MPQRDQVEKMRNLISNVNHFFYSHSHLASFLFRPSRCLRALSQIKNHTLWENLNKRRTQVAIFNRIRFRTFVQQAVKFGVSFLASLRKPKNSNVFVAMHV